MDEIINQAMQDSSIVQIFTSLNTWLVCLATGTLLWAVQQIVSESFVNKAWWKKIMKISPLVVGALLALIPDLNPVSGNLTHSAIVGFIVGSLAQSAYDLLREYGPDRMRQLLGARAKRNGNG
ncbi:MAG: hypothetical protein GY841_15760 [FCB group bacterium]|nr:hypothetical protein [FCB group bacterium]